MPTASVARLDAPKAISERESDNRVADAVHDAEALERTGKEMLAQQEHLDALRHFERALQIRYRTARLVTHITDAELDAMTLPAQREELQQQCCTAADAVVVLYNDLAVKAFKRGNFEAASHMLSNAFRIADSSDDFFFGSTDTRHRLKSTTLNNFGCMERRRGRLAVALQYMRQALDFGGTQSVAVLLNIAAVLTQMGQADEAVGAARRAVGLLDHDREDNRALAAIARHNLAMALERIDVGDAIVEYEKARDLSIAANAPQTTALIEQHLNRVVELRGRPVDTTRKTSPRVVQRHADEVARRSPPQPTEDDHWDHHEPGVAVTDANTIPEAFEAPPQSDYQYPVRPVKPYMSRTGQPHTDGTSQHSHQAKLSLSDTDGDAAVRQAIEVREKAAGRAKPAGTLSDVTTTGPSTPLTPLSRHNTGAPNSVASQDVAPGSGVVPPKALDKATPREPVPPRGRPPTHDTPTSAPLRGAEDARSTRPPKSDTPTGTGTSASTPTDTPTKPQAVSTDHTGPAAHRPTSSPSHKDRPNSSGQQPKRPVPPSTLGIGRLPGRMREEEEMKKEDAISYMFQRLAALLRQEDDYEVRYLAARRIQCCARRYLGQKMLKTRRQLRRDVAARALAVEDRGAKSIARFFRGIKRQKELVREEAARARIREHIIIQKVVVIQCGARRWLARRFVKRVRRYNAVFDASTRVIQRSVRVWLAYRTARRMRAALADSSEHLCLLGKQTYAASLFQAAWRRHHERIKMLLRQGNIKAARDRGWLLGRNEAATRIQKRCRGYMVRKQYNPVLLDRRKRRKGREHAARRLNATILLQSLVRGAKTRYSLRAPYRVHLKDRAERRRLDAAQAATRIQCLVRCAVARLELRRRRALRYREREESRAGTLVLSVRQFERSLQREQADARA